MRCSLTSMVPRVRQEVLWVSLSEYGNKPTYLANFVFKPVLSFTENNRLKQYQLSGSNSSSVSKMEVQHPSLLSFSNFVFCHDFWIIKVSRAVRLLDNCLNSLSITSKYSPKIVFRNVVCFLFSWYFCLFSVAEKIFKGCPKSGIF